MVQEGIVGTDEVVHGDIDCLTCIYEGVIEQQRASGYIFRFTRADRHVAKTGAVDEELEVIVAEQVVLLDALNLDLGDVSHAVSISGPSGAVHINVQKVRPEARGGGSQLP